MAALVDAGELQAGEDGEGVLLLGARLGVSLGDDAVGERLADLLLHVFLEAPDEQALDLVPGVVVRVRDGRGIEHVHEAREAAGLAVMRGRGQQDQGVGSLGEDLGDAGALGPAPAADGDVVGLVDDDDVPPGGLDVGAEGVVLLERVDGDDGAVEVMEGVVVGRDVLADPLQALGVQPHERDGEAAPHLLLELGEHALDGGDEDALAPAPADELGHEGAGAHGLAEADGVRDEDALARLGQGLAGRIELEVHDVHGCAVADVEVVAGGRHVAEQALHVEEGVAVAGRGVELKVGLRGVEHGDARLELLEEDGLLVAHDLGDAHDVPRGLAGAGEVDLEHAPDGVADQDVRAGRDGEVSGGLRGIPYVRHRPPPERVRDLPRRGRARPGSTASEL